MRAGRGRRRRRRRSGWLQRSARKEGGGCGRVSFYLVLNEKEEESPSESEDALDPSE